MSKLQIKPRLVFFQYKYNGLAPFLLVHQREHVECLAQFFEVTVVQQDCDYEQICDEYQPDLAMFESGVPFPTCTRPLVKNVRACAHVPKVGFLHADGFGEGRTGFFSDMEHWGIETFFTIATTAVEHTPALAGKVFVWPNFVNPELYRDYGQAKSIDVLFTGNKNSLYPWRQKMVSIVPRHFPSVICAHPGYSRQKSSATVVGEAYARMLNSAWFVPACGTVAKEIVRKHFEVPACRSCLVSEKSAALDAAGFIDMQNCVFVDENDVVERLQYLLAHRGELQALIDAGHQLVHSRHTMKYRDQVLQWFTLNKNLKPGHKIIQTNPFEPLRIVGSEQRQESVYIRSNGELVSRLREADQCLRQGEYAVAQELYLQCVSQYRYMPEPLLGLTLCNLFLGKPREALKWILKPLVASLAEYDAIDPDPVEWGYFILVLLCLGRLRQAVRRSREFEWLHHPELDRVRWITSTFLGQTARGSLPAVDRQQHRLTVHDLPSRSMKEWTRTVQSMLRSCGQTKLAQRLAILGITQDIGDEAPAVSDSSHCAVEESETRRTWSRNAPFVFLKTDAHGMFYRRRLYRDLSVKLKQATKYALRRVAALGASSELRRSDFAQAIHQLTRNDVRTALFIGVPPQDVSARAMMASSRTSSRQTRLLCLTWSSATRTGESNRLNEISQITLYKLPSTNQEEALLSFDLAIERAKHTIQNQAFDLIVVDPCASQLSKCVALKRELHNARFVVLAGINDALNHEHYGDLLRDRNYTLLEYKADLRGGCAVFEKAKPHTATAFGTQELAKAHA